MSYLVVARKWRPQTFDEVIGQPHVTKTLQNAISSGRVAHAYLFTGARGVGKTSVARILAKALNCEKGASPAPCNECSNCREITQSNAVDVLEIDGASNRGIDSIRELRETVRYRPAKSRHKVYIIDEVHMLTTEAFNALLKTLEEPPEHVIFIFATTEPHKIPATILSRCQRFDFRRIPMSILVKHLGGIARREGAGLSDTVLYSIAREADGSMRDAQSLLEQLLAFSGDGLSDVEVLDILGVVDRQTIHRIGRAILTGDVGGCLKGVEDLYRRGTDSKRFCQQLCEHFRNLLLLSLEEPAGGGASWLDLPEEERDALRDEVKETSQESLHLYFQMMIKGEEEIRRSSLPRVALEMLLLRLAQLPRLESLEKLLETLSSLQGCYPAPSGYSGAPGKNRSEESLQPAAGFQFMEKRAPGAAGAVSESASPDLDPPPHGTASQTDPEPGKIEERWPAFVRRLQDKDPILGAKLVKSRAALSGQSTLEVEVVDLYADSFREPGGLAKLQNAVQSYFGESAKYEVRVQVLTKTNPKTSQKPEREESRRNTKHIVMEHPVVLAAIEILGGELVDIRPAKVSPSDRDSA
jgi:DNA polymerase-3 subunit gamma/tau